MKLPLRTNLVLAASTVLLFSLCFPPIDISLSAYVCLTPWFIIIAREDYRTVFSMSWLIGLLFFFINVAWIRHVTYPAWFALGLYLSLYFPVFGLATRFIHRNSCLPLTIAAPVGWIAQEYVRSFMIRGFPWLFVGHTQYMHLSVIQIADITGVYGISFVIVTVNACIADIVLLSGQRRSRRRIAALAAWTVLLTALTLGYGAYRLAQYAPSVGPRICVVQGCTPQSLKMKTDLPSCREMLRQHEAVSLEAAGQEMDLVVWPETMVPGYLNLIEFLDHLKDSDFAILAKESLAALQRVSERLGAPLLVGGQAYVPTGTEFLTYNSAFLFKPSYFKKHGKIFARYDKIHLVPFGEYVPFRKSLPFLTNILSKLAGYIPDFSPGTDESVFMLKGHKFGVLICYEDTIARLVRKFRYRDGERRADFLINISNDGWFCGSSELDQHLAICVFRAVENRVGIARAVNTGISGFIAPNGHIEAVITHQAKRKQVTGVLVRPILLDHRVSFYARYGDLFGPACFLAWIGILLYCAISRHKRNRNGPGI